MRLLISDGGILCDVVEDIDEFDLSKTVARAEVAQAIEEAIERIRADAEEYGT